MKKFAASALLLSAVLGDVMAQTPVKPDYIKRPAIGVHFIMQDFPSATYLRANSLSAAINDKKFAKLSEMSPGLAISYWKGVTNHLDFVANVSGSFLKYPYKNRPASTQEKFLMEIDATANAKMLPDNYWVSPYLTAGVGISSYSGYWGTYIPLGTGIQVNLFDETFIHLQSQYRLGISDNSNYHFYWGVGFLGNIGKKRETPKVEPVILPTAPLDTDGDGIPDAEDACPNEAGPASLKGCPDKDGDGIADKDDKCPDVKGLAVFQGCPPPDKDGDGIMDSEDKCPDVAGVARFKGCPVPDTDGDGLNDEVDHCPMEAGPASNNGCPEVKQEIIEKVNMAASQIFFASGSAKFTANSYKYMNEVVKVLKEDETLELDIEGHTDNTGSAAINTKLSQSRADAVMKYLVSKGIDAARLTSKGFGPDQPVADNGTAAGKAKNRRVEMKVRK